MFTSQKQISSLTALAIIVAFSVGVFGGAFFYKSLEIKKAEAILNTALPVITATRIKTPAVVSGDACGRQNGRILNTLGGETCEPSEINIGEVEGMDCPCVCCVKRDENQATIATDKIGYQTATVIKITITNNSNGKIDVSSCPFGEGFVLMDKKDSAEQWQKIFLPSIDLACQTVHHLLKGESRQYTWDEFMSRSVYDSHLNVPGVYRIKFGYPTPNLPGNVRWIYSNEFSIK